MYQLQSGNDFREFETRAEAIADAKELSLESRQPVVVSDEEQRERLTYTSGELESYTYETRTKSK